MVVAIAVVAGGGGLAVAELDLLCPCFRVRAEISIDEVFSGAQGDFSSKSI